jgi:hypothetical protein
MLASNQSTLNNLAAVLCCRKQYPVTLGCMSDTMQTLDTHTAVLKRYFYYPPITDVQTILVLCCRKQYPIILGCMSDTMQNLDKDIAAAAGGAADFDIEHHVLIATNKVIARGFLQLPEGFVDPEQQAHDVPFIMATASRFICEPWRWVGHLYLPFLTAVSASSDGMKGCWRFARCLFCDWRSASPASGAGWGTSTCPS